jgi:predicted nucleic acid-binding protein
MPRRVLVDAGPVVAFLLETDSFHVWAVEQFKRFSHFTTCEAVLAEACARLAYYGKEQSRVMDLVVDGSLLVDFDAGQSADRLSSLMRKYADRPMDLADACLVMMTEQVSDSVVVTLDRADFSVYRRHERQVIPYVCPPGR